MQNLFQEMEDLLRQKDEFFSQDGSLLRNLVIEKGLKLDPELIDLLLSHDRIKQHFFTQVGDVLVFDKEKFLQFVNNKQFLPDSYTAFKNKIGLSNDGGKTLLSRKQEVELVWPYKDCVLEGGQTKEEAKRDEIFWNTTLAPDDISRLIEPKVLTNWKKYDEGGVHEVIRVDILNNLIIKGNNLLALNSIFRNYSGKIKLIYIDPPYNTGNDSFGYNDQFNHSSWLTFMKNRLQLTKGLLCENGVIWINVDDNEAHYLKIIMDNLFGRENFIANVIWEKSDSPRMDAEYFSTRHDHILVYAKHKESFRINQLELDEIPDHYNRVDEYGRRYYLKPLRAMGGQGSTRKARPNLYYQIEAPDGSKVFPKLQDGTDGAWRWSKEKIENENDRIDWVNHEDNWTPYYRIYAEDNLTRPPETIWPCTEVGSNRTSKSELTSLFSTSEAFSTPKPEALIKRIIHLSSKPDDIVLDFFAGSGTTGAVSLKMGRRFILIEQMESIEKTTIPRMKKVIEGEQGGISENTEWQGGGEFIYCELLEWNENFIRKIEDASDKVEVLKIWQEIQAKAHLSYQVDIKSINENIEEFENLSLEDQKKFLLEVLDKNALYVNLSEIDDVEYGVSEEDKRLNRQFYGVEA